MPSHIRERVACALECGALTVRATAASIRSVVGGSGDAEATSGALATLASLGVSDEAAAAWIRSIGAAQAGTTRTDLVWSGPSVAGVHARDTRQAHEELVGIACRSLWVSTFVFFDGPKSFDVIARRMAQVPGLRVTLLLNVRRTRGDAAGAEEVVRRFAERLWGAEWPGDIRPRVFYDPRALERDGPTGVLHAKAVVADDEAVLVTSANLTEAAFDRNIELGLLVRDRALAGSIVAHFRGLIESGLLHALPAR
jgi:phosphatidylserine/phosphatidylglycerophosphate/cardiolipin synthase-like enzyme